MATYWEVWNIRETQAFEAKWTTIIAQRTGGEMKFYAVTVLHAAWGRGKLKRHQSSYHQ